MFKGYVYFTIGSDFVHVTVPEIGYDTFSLHRASGEIDESSYNFLTKKKSITNGKNISGEDEKPITQWSKIISKTKLTFSNIEKDPDFGWL